MWNNGDDKLLDMGVKSYNFMGHTEQIKLLFIEKKIGFTNMMEVWNFQFFITFPAILQPSCN